MNTTENTMLITGGGSGIGRALAEAFHKLGNKVIIAGRRQSNLDEVTTQNHGMKSVTLDITSASAIKMFAAKLESEFPSLNVVIHNAGIMKVEKLLAQQSMLADVEATITTNLLGPIRLTAALLPLLQKQMASTIMTVTSGLAFVPMAMTPTYCATKAAIHSYTQSLRYQLKNTTTQVIELAPPYVQTELMGEHQKTDPRAMPLGEFIDEVMSILKTQPNATEVIVERCKPMRFAEKTGQFDSLYNGMNAAWDH